jgi:azurin
MNARRLNLPAMDRLFALFLFLAAAAAGRLGAAPAYSPEPIRIDAVSGLKFSPNRFVIHPGEAVTVEFRNTDEMIHNFVIVEPGARLEVVNAALALGADGPGRNFIPASDKILFHTPALNPGGTATLRFTAPEKQGVYPFVCTFPGHGLVMYGVMYVAGRNLKVPNADADPNVPIPQPPAVDEADHSHGILDAPLVERTFMPDCGPDAIVIGLPGGNSLCFDATLCRIRYAWNGGFVDSVQHWLGKGDVLSKVVGNIYYRAAPGAGFRIGAPSHESQPRWLGYDLDKGYPVLRYRLDEALVEEEPLPLPGGDRSRGGFLLRCRIASTVPVYFVTDAKGGASFQSSAGAFEGGVLTLSPEQARSFTLTVTKSP